MKWHNLGHWDSQSVYKELNGCLNKWGFCTCEAIGINTCIYTFQPTLSTSVRKLIRNFIVETSSIHKMAQYDTKKPAKDI